MTRVERVMERIQESGGRVTVPTVLVASILAETDRHLTADDVIDELERRQAGIAASTVYRVLQRLAEMGLLEHVRSGAGATFYHLLERPHTHLVCSACGSVLDLDQRAEAALRALTAIVRAEHGFELEPHHGALLGSCRGCATSSHQRHQVDHSAPGDEPFMVHRTPGRDEPFPLERRQIDHQGGQT